MKKYFSIFFWILATLISSFMYVTYFNSYIEAWLLSIMMLPGVLIIKFITPLIKREPLFFKILHSLYLIVFILYIEYLCFLLAYWYLFKLDIKTVPKIIVNPVFLGIWLIFFIILEKIIAQRYLRNKIEEDSEIDFISDRKRIALKTALISFIESNDNEVWVHLITGKKYRTKMRISQWENVLNNQFIRIHRSYIVNTKHIQLVEKNRLLVDNVSLEISRSYKDKISMIL